MVLPIAVVSKFPDCKGLMVKFWKHKRALRFSRTIPTLSFSYRFVVEFIWQQNEWSNAGVGTIKRLKEEKG